MISISEVLFLLLGLGIGGVAMGFLVLDDVNTIMVHKDKVRNG